MLFGIIMLVLVAAVAFYHYIQGFFSAMISCMLVILAAVVAVAYHEPVAEGLLAQHLPAYAHAVVLVVMFALAYAFMRLVADRLVPGNVRFHVLVDKIGAGVCGAVAGIFATGVLAVAAQSMPFGPSIGGYARMPLADRGEISFNDLPRKYYSTNFGVWNELDRDNLDSASGLFPLPVDGAVLGLTSYLSDGGSLAGNRSMARIHPDYATELFGNRLGQPFGGGDVLYTSAGVDLNVGEVYTSQWVLNNPEDIEATMVRGDRTMAVSAEGATPVVIRASLQGMKGTGALTMSAVRLVIKGKNYYPIGSYQRGEQLVLTRPDDPLFIEAGRSVDFVFLVDSEQLQKVEGSGLVLPAGSLIEVKRAARVDLSGKEVSENAPGTAANIGVLTKTKPKR